MHASFLIILILLVFDNGKANVFKRIDSDCQPSGVHCLSSNTFTYCLNRGGVSALLYFEFNCPRNYICDDSAKSACVRRPVQPTILNNAIKTTTESKLMDTILNSLISNSLQEQANVVMGRVPPVQIEAEDVNVHNIGSGSVIITPTITTTTRTPLLNNKLSNKITPTNFLTSGSVIFAEDSGEDSDSTIITSDGVNTDPSGSVIITPDSPSSSEDGSSVIITQSDPNSPGSVIITPDTMVSSGSVIITPDNGDSVIITPTTTRTSLLNNKLSNKITPISFLTSGSVIFAEDSGEDPDSTIITSNGDNIGPGGSVIITPDSPSSSEDGSSIIIIPSDPKSPGSVIITPDTTVSSGSVIITPDNGDSVIITPTTTTPGPIIIVPKIDSKIKESVILTPEINEPLGSATKTPVFSNNLLNKIIPINVASGSIIFAENTDEETDSTIITSNGTNTGGVDGSVIITPETTPSSRDVIITPQTPPPSGSIIITPEASTPDSIIITPNGTYTNSNGSVIITPETTPSSGDIIITPTTLSSSGRVVITPDFDTNIELTHDSIIVEPKIAEEPLIKQSIIITPVTTVTPPGVIITPSSSTTSGSVIIVPTTTISPGSGSTPPNCTSVGYYWGPSCTEYYECIAVWWWYEYRLKTCDTGFWFSLANEMCVNPSSSECV